MAKSNSSKTNGAELIAKANAAFESEERTNAETTWQALAKYILPAANNNFRSKQHAKGVRQGQDVYDSTAEYSCRDLASSMHSTITNPTTKWHRIRFRSDQLNNMPEAVSWLDQANDTLFYELADSNFNGQIGRCYQSIGALGTFILLHEEKMVNGQYAGMNFVAWHIGEVAFTENQYGQIDTFYRKFKWTAKKAVEAFGDEVGDDVMRAYNERPMEEFEFYHVIAPRPPESVKKNSYGESKGTDRPFSSCYILAKGSKVVKETGYYECPVYVGRWLTLPGEVYGYGPGHVTIADVLTLNAMVKDTLKGLARAVGPPIAVQENNLLTGDLRPNKIVVMRDIQAFKEMGTQARFDVGFMEQDKLKESIKSGFYIDKLQLPPRTDTGEMTAYEIQQRLAQMQVILGPVLSSLNSDVLGALIMRSIKMLIRARKIPPIPKSVTAMAQQLNKNSQSVDIDIMYLNQLARSQQTADLQNITDFMQELTGLAQIKPEALDKINADAIVDETARIRNIPESIINSDQQVAQQRQQRQQQMQTQQALQAGESVSNMAKNAGQAQGPGIQTGGK